MMYDEKIVTVLQSAFRNAVIDLRRLDSEVFFGVGEERKRVIINAEIVPPSYEERQRLLRLNPQSDLLSEYVQFSERKDDL